MVKYGLRPGTLKGELFRILLEQGNDGLKVFQLARSSQVRCWKKCFCFYLFKTVHRY